MVQADQKDQADQVDQEGQEALEGPEDQIYHLLEQNQSQLIE